MTDAQPAHAQLEHQLAVVVKQSQLAPSLVDEITRNFAPLYQTAQNTLDDAAKINVTDASDLRQMEAAGVLRKTLKSIRGTAEKHRVAMTADALKIKSTVDLVARTLRTELEQAEEWLEGHEKYAERLQAQREAALKAERSAVLRGLGCTPEHYRLDTMPEDDWRRLLAACQKQHDDQIAAEKAAEERRQAEAKAREAENARIREENARIERELAETKAQAEIERKAAEAEKRLAAERARRAQEERDRADTEAAERIRRDREAMERAAEAERKAAADKAAEAKRAADAKIAAETRARRAAEAAAIDLLAFVRDALPYIERHDRSMHQRGLDLVAKAEGRA